MAQQLYRLRFRRIAARVKTSSPAARAFVIVQIDALSISALQAALAGGDMPFLARLLQHDGHRVFGWRSGLPSCTTAIQSGLFYGVRTAPGFRWFDKVAGVPLTSHRPDHMRALEEGLRSTQAGLLKGGGVYTSLLSGDADRAVFTVSRVFGRQLQGYLEGTGLLLSFFLRPLRVLRLLRYALARFGRRLWVSIRSLRLPHFSWGRELLEALVDAMFLEFMTFCVLLDLYRGVPRMYANYNGYDEMAHEHGILHDESLRALRWIDARLAEIVRLGVGGGGTTYDVFIISDHGMAPAIAFRVRYGLTLGQFVAQAVNLDVGFEAGAADIAASRALRARYFVTMMRDSKSRMPLWSRRLVRAARRPLMNYISRQESAYDWRLEGEVVVQASGPLAHIYFRVTAEPMDLPEVALLYAGLMQKLVGHDGIDLVAGRDTDRVVILGRKGGVITLGDSTCDLQGPDPLAGFVDRDYILRELHHIVQLPDSGDLILLGRLLDTGEVITFEEQKATHGGLGYGQDEPFIIVPGAMAAAWPGVDSPEALYQWFKTVYPDSSSKGPDCPEDNHENPQTEAHDEGPSPAD